MSIQFNDTSTYKGLVQIFEKECGYNRGDISGNTDLLKEFAADVNIAMDDFLSIALPAAGKWQLDDSNHTDYPIIYTNIVSGQRDYSFTSDATGNLVLDIYKVAVLPSATSILYEEIFPIDQQSELSDILTESTTGGTPDRYDKTANALFLDPVPNYSVTKGIKVYINRETTYFTSNDTTKKPGVPGIFHEYFALKPALKYAGRHSLSNYNDLLRRVADFEGDEKRGITGKIVAYFSKRSRDEQPVMTYEQIDYL